MNENGKPVGPVDVAAFLAEIRAGNVKERTRTIEVYLNAPAADEANAILERLDRLERETTGAQVGISEADPVSVERAELEARYDDLAEAFRSSLVTMTFRSERVGDGEAIDAAMKADQADVNSSEARMAYRIAYHCVEPKLAAQDLIDLMPVLGSEQVLKMLNACERTLRAPAPLSRKPFAGRGTGKR